MIRIWGKKFRFRTGPHTTNAQCYDFKFHVGWAVQMDFLFENCTFEENRSILPFQINLTIICQRKSCEEFRTGQL